MIEVKIKPLTSNNAYVRQRNGGRFITKEARAYKDCISASCGVLWHMENYLDWMVFRYQVCGPWRTKTGSIALNRGDIDGYAKLLLDAVCERLGVNDALVKRIEGEKVEAQEWSVRFWLEPFLAASHA
jgi:Holliday junction resolvase RusA-like endonuclease